MTVLIKIPGFIDDVASGMVANDLAEKYHVSAPRVRVVAKKHNLSLVHAKRGNNPGAGRRRSFDYAEAVRLREGGATYQSIGDHFDITRERVRQILHLEGRSDLCFRVPKLPRGNCLNCGGSLEHVGRKQKHCNQKCFSEYAAKTLSVRQSQIVEAVLYGRTESPPVKWREIGQNLGVHHGSLPTRFRTACAKVGINPAVAFHNKKRAA